MEHVHRLGRAIPTPYDQGSEMALLSPVITPYVLLHVWLHCYRVLLEIPCIAVWRYQVPSAVPVRNTSETQVCAPEFQRSSSVMEKSWAAVAPPTALIAPGAPRSEHDPERAVLAADTITMHRLTGTFTDPSHEQTFAALLFRLAFPIHVLSLTLSFVAVSVGDMHVAWSSPISPTVSQWGAWVTASLTLVLSLVRPA